MAVEVPLELGLVGRSLSEIDLADQAGVTGFGAADDAGPLMLGVRGAIGLRTLDVLELRLFAELGAGGLDLAAVEARYAGAEDEQLGGNLFLGVGGQISATIPLGERVRAIGGIDLGHQWLNAVSPAVTARARSLFVGGHAGMRIDVAPSRRAVQGHLQILFDYWHHVPMGVEAAGGEESDDFSTSDPSGAGWQSFGLLLGYGLRFPLTHPR